MNIRWPRWQAIAAIVGLLLLAFLCAFPTWFTARINERRELLTALQGLALSVLVWPILSIAGLWLLYLALRRAYRLVRRPPQLMVLDFTNSTGVGDLDKTISGMSQLAREHLVREMWEVRRQVSDNVGRLVPGAERPPRWTPLPDAGEDKQLADLVKSLAEVVPGQTKPLVSLLAIAFPREGTSVACTLQRRGEAPDRLGMTFVISDLGGAGSEPLTVWEPKPPASEPGSGRAGDHGTGNPIGTRPHHRDAESGATGTPGSEPGEAQALFELGRLYERRRALDQAKGFYEEALKKRPDLPQAREALGRVLEGRRTPVDRYVGGAPHLGLLQPASRALAYRLSMRTMLAEPPPGLRTRRADRRKVEEQRQQREDYECQVSHFFGVLHQASGMVFEEYGPQFYRLSERLLLDAIELIPGWYAPYENLAVTYSFWGRQAVERRLVSRLEGMGYTVTLQPAA